MRRESLIYRHVALKGETARWKKKWCMTLPIVHYFHRGRL